MTIDPPPAAAPCAGRSGRFPARPCICGTGAPGRRKVQPADVPRHHELQELLGPLVGLVLVDVDRVDVAGEDVADRADDHVAFFVDAAGLGLLLQAADNHLPQAQQVRHVARQFFLGAVRTGRADDEPQPLGRVELQQRIAERAAQLVVLDFPRDADAPQRRHQHQVAARNADVGGQSRPLGADPFLDHLDEDFIAAAEDFLDRRLDARAAAAIEPAAIAAAITPPSAVASAIAPSTPWPATTIRPTVVLGRRVVVAGIDVGHPASAHRLAGIEAPLAKVLRLDVADVQKPVAADAKIDERRLDARLQVDDPPLVDVADESLLAGPLNVEFFEQVVFEDRNPAFFRLRHVDQHFAFH